jgi:hypothetical protein
LGLKIATKEVVQFLLAAVSIICLLLDFYDVISMRNSVYYGLLPASLVLIIWLLLAVRRQDRESTMVIGYGAFFGFVAAIAYDIYRIPFALQGMPIFSVFPKFGQLILHREAPAWMIHSTGWLYHFSNGMGFGIMYMAVARRWSWQWAMIWALVIEVAMLLSPYLQKFGFVITPSFLFVTLSAHLIFGLILGLMVRRWRMKQWKELNPDYAN